MSAAFITLLLFGVAILTMVAVLPGVCLNHPLTWMLLTVPMIGLLLLVIFVANPVWISRHLPRLLAPYPWGTSPDHGWAWILGGGGSNPLTARVWGNEVSFTLGALALPIGVSLISSLRHALRRGALRCSRRWGGERIFLRESEPVRFWIEAGQRILLAAMMLTMGLFSSARLIGAALGVSP